jgi:hypothetical protein
VVEVVMRLFGCGWGCALEVLMEAREGLCWCREADWGDEDVMDVRLFRGLLSNGAGREGAEGSLMVLIYGVMVIMMTMMMVF